MKSVAYITDQCLDVGFLLFIHEVNMAKRRNPKKEKALRNQAYARKFRKRTTTGRMQRRFQQRPPKSEEDEGTGAAAMDAAE
ncbi:hypothetical protein [Trichormus azollae]|uniref:Uncharacterized protein n=1 Tax=Nostoc azollae (strain 0708) TaxID=551115 RepID=D7E367_NOSA0|nr:hypothetical protein [Trichormus azollae]ADI63490.1 hypothetical protein Aazo_1168 ['Nostoc azollae' 0708]